MSYTDEELARMDQLEIDIEQARAEVIDNIPGAVVEVNAALRHLENTWMALESTMVSYMDYDRSQFQNDFMKGPWTNTVTHDEVYWWQTTDIFEECVWGSSGYSESVAEGRATYRPAIGGTRTSTLGIMNWLRAIQGDLGGGRRGRGRQAGPWPSDEQFRERFDSQDLNDRQTIIADVFSKNHGDIFSSFNEADDDDEAFMVPDGSPCLQTYTMGKYSYTARKEQHDDPVFTSGQSTMSDGWEGACKRYAMNFVPARGIPFFSNTAWECFFLARNPETYWLGGESLGQRGSYAWIDSKQRNIETNMARGSNGDYAWNAGAWCADTVNGVLFAGVFQRTANTGTGRMDGPHGYPWRARMNKFNASSAPSLSALGSRICRSHHPNGFELWPRGNPRVKTHRNHPRGAAQAYYWQGNTHGSRGPISARTSERVYDNFNAAWHALDRLSAASNAIAQLEENWVRRIDELQRTIERDLPDWDTPAGFFSNFVDMWTGGAADAASDVAEEAIQQYRDRVAPTGNVVGGAWQRQMLFKEQCFMLTYIQQIAARAAELKAIKRLAYLPGVRPPGYGLSARTPLSIVGGALLRSLQAATDALEIETTDTTAEGNTGAGSVLSGEANAYAQDNITWDGQACILADGRPYAFVNQLTQDPDENAFFKMKTQEISSLQPMIRLYRVPMSNDDRLGASDGATTDPMEVEYEFDDVTSEVNRLMRTRGQRGVGVGVKKFSFTYDGSSPFSAKKSIKATLEIFANSFGDLLRPQKNSDGQWYRYAELAMKTATNGKNMAAGVDREGETSNDPADNPNWTRLYGRCAGDRGDNWNDARERGEPAVAVGKSETNEWDSKFNFVLKAVVGWAMPNGTNNLLSSAVRRGIYNSFVTLQLTPTVHEFDIDDQGRVIFRINYLAFTEDFYAQPLYSIFADKTIVAKQTLRRLFYRYHAKLCDSEEMRNIKENDAEIIMEEKRRSVQSFIQALFDNDKIFYIDKPYPELRAWISEGPFAENMDDVTILDSESIDTVLGSHVHEAIAAYDGENADEVATALGASVNAGVDPNAVQVGFFFISDMIDIALQNIESSLLNQYRGSRELQNQSELYPFHTGNPGESGVFQIDPCDYTEAHKKARTAYKALETLRIVLGPLEIVHQGGDSPPIIVNIGDIPVSVKYFAEFLTKKLGSQNEVVYPLTNFVNDLLQDLIRNFLNNDTCFNTEIKQKIRVNSAAITSYKNKKSDGTFEDVDTLTQKIVSTEQGRWHRRVDLRNLPASERPLLNISGQRDMPDGGNPGQEGQVNYMVYFAGRTTPREEMNADPAEDAQKGIQHYILGEDRGIVKKIKLSKTNSTGLQEVRYETAGYDAFKQLHIVYDVDIETYANVKTFPGSYVFVDPRGFAPQTNLKQGDQYNLTEYGIGGYCMIIRSTTTIEAGSASTKLHTKWVHSAENVLDAAQEESDVEANRGDNEDFTECRSLARTAPAAPSMSMADSEGAGWGDVGGELLSYATDSVGVTDPADPSEAAE